VGSHKVFTLESGERPLARPVVALNVKKEQLGHVEGPKHIAAGSLVLEPRRGDRFLNFAEPAVIAVTQML